MATATTNQNQQSILDANKYYLSATAIQIRLDTQKILDNIEYFLRGAKPSLKETPEGIVTEYIQIGQPRANALGIQSILNYIGAVINPQVVQGNFNEKQYDLYIEEVHIEFCATVVNNCYNWEIDDDDIDLIIDFVMKLVIPFISRLIDNKERESYTDTIRSSESNVIQNKGGFGLFKSKE